MSARGGPHTVTPRLLRITLSYSAASISESRVGPPMQDPELEKLADTLFF
jgi:hypothetical protein